jgi:hypothetical protein
VQQLISEGINVNVTLLFSPERYRAAATAYIEGLEKRRAQAGSIAEIRSVASFFISRIDTKVDAAIAARAAEQPALASVSRSGSGGCVQRLRMDIFTSFFPQTDSKTLSKLADTHSACCGQAQALKILRTAMSNMLRN